MIASQKEKHSRLLANAPKSGGVALESVQNQHDVGSQIQMLEKALASVLYDLGGTHERLRENEDAQKAYQRSIEKASSANEVSLQSNAHAALGGLYERVGNIRDAEVFHARALKLHPLCGMSVSPLMWVSSFLFLSDRWDHPNYAIGLHPHHRRPTVVSPDDVLETIEDLSRPKEEFIAVDRSEGLSQLEQALKALPEGLEERKTALAVALEESAKIQTGILTLELDSANAVLRSAEARLPANQHYQLASAYIYASVMHKRLGQYAATLRKSAAIFAHWRVFLPG